MFNRLNFRLQQQQQPVVQTPGQFFQSYGQQQQPPQAQQQLPPGTWVSTNNQQITVVNAGGSGMQQTPLVPAPPQHHQVMMACGAQPALPMQQHIVVSASSAGIQTSSANLPYDLQNLMPDQSIMDLDMEAVLRHELAQTQGNQINFDL